MFKKAERSNLIRAGSATLPLAEELHKREHSSGFFSPEKRAIKKEWQKILECHAQRQEALRNKTKRDLFFPGKSESPLFFPQPANDPGGLMSRFFSRTATLPYKKKKKEGERKKTQRISMPGGLLPLNWFQISGGNGFSSFLVFLDSEAATGGNRPETEAEEKEEI